MDYITYYLFSFCQVFVPLLLFAGLPALFYYHRVKPTLRKKAVSVFVSLGVMIVTASIPMGWLLLYKIWQVAVILLLLITAVVWIYAAIKKKDPFTAGPIMIGVTGFVSAALLGNLLALGGAIVYIFTLLRYKMDWSFN